MQQASATLLGAQHRSSQSLLLFKPGGSDSGTYKPRDSDSGFYKPGNSESGVSSLSTVLLGPGTKPAAARHAQGIGSIQQGNLSDGPVRGKRFLGLAPGCAPVMQER